MCSVLVRRELMELCLQYGLRQRPGLPSPHRAPETGSGRCCALAQRARAEPLQSQVMLAMWRDKTSEAAEREVLASVRNLT